jgi:hypothetical protein
MRKACEHITRAAPSASGPRHQDRDQEGGLDQGWDQDDVKLLEALRDAAGEQRSALREGLLSGRGCSQGGFGLREGLVSGRVWSQGGLALGEGLLSGRVCSQGGFALREGLLSGRADWAVDKIR